MEASFEIFGASTSFNLAFGFVAYYAPWHNLCAASGEIQMIVIAAGGVEGGVAMRAAGITLEIGGDGKRRATVAAEDGLFVPFRFGPGFDAVVCERVMAIFAGVIHAAAFHFDCDDIELGVVMKAAGLGIEIEAVDFWSGRKHGNGEDRG